MPRIQNGIPRKHFAWRSCIAPTDLRSVQVGHIAVVVIHGKPRIHVFAQVVEIECVPEVNAVGGEISVASSPSP